MTLWERLALLAYGALTWALQPWLRRKLGRRGRAEPGYLAHVPERFGHYEQPATPEGGWLWLHAVSLGETRAAALLLPQLRQRWPDRRLLLTHGTATGRAEGAKLLRPGDVQVWQPWDTPGAVKRFLAHFRPAVGLLMETEVWPQLVNGCQRAGVPLLLLNARLSERSLRQAQKLGVWAGPAYRQLSAVYAQTEADADRLRTLGARVLGVHGNLKFDVPWHPDPWARGRQWRAQLPPDRPVLVWASSREGEERLWLEAMARQPWAGVGRPLWLVVPRHPQRFDEVAAMLKDTGWKVWRRSQVVGTEDVLPPEALDADVWLGDSLGEMPLYYGLGHMALLGGSFLPLGGQNLIEAAACGCPVVMGPHTFNFAEAAVTAEQLGAARRAESMVQALDALAEWTRKPELRDVAERACERLIASGAGAAGRYAQAVADWFKAPSAAR